MDACMDACMQHAVYIHTYMCIHYYNISMSIYGHICMYVMYVCNVCM